ncbi:unnamed protein product [Leptosia nina]|uniref:Uncharacterized protein n=1 Tax=Leptosia nina TaxID=320188 RepID=A0AAV1JEA3_9NEOP
MNYKHDAEQINSSNTAYNDIKENDEETSNDMMENEKLNKTNQSAGDTWIQFNRECCGPFGGFGFGGGGGGGGTKRSSRKPRVQQTLDIRNFVFILFVTCLLHFVTIGCYLYAKSVAEAKLVRKKLFIASLLAGINIMNFGLAEISIMFYPIFIIAGGVVLAFFVAELWNAMCSVCEAFMIVLQLIAKEKIDTNDFDIPLTSTLLYTSLFNLPLQLCSSREDEE